MHQEEEEEEEGEEEEDGRIEKWIYDTTRTIRAIAQGDKKFAFEKIGQQQSGDWRMGEGWEEQEHTRLVMKTRMCSLRAGGLCEERMN